MNQRLREAEITNTDGVSLNDRIAVTKQGQCTWAIPGNSNRCASCAHYSDGSVSKGKHEGHGRCGLVKKHTRKRGVLFDGASAFACTMFRPKH